MKIIKLIAIFNFWLSIFSFSQPPTDFRDNFTGYYLSYNYPYQNILVEKDLFNSDSLYITDSLWGEAPRPDCPVNCVKHRVILNGDSSWTGFASYHGDFKRLDTIHLFYLAPGPFAYNYDAKKISPIGITNYQNINVSCYLFPNPVLDYMNVLVSNYDKPLKISLYDANGKLCRTEEFIKSIQMETMGLMSGLYYVRIEGENVHFKKSLVIVEH